MDYPARSARRFMMVLVSMLLPLTACLAVDFPSPEAHFGFKPGADRKLIDYEGLVEYLQVLDAASDRIEMREVGCSPLDRPMYVVFISTPENLANLEALQAINKRLALDPDIEKTGREALFRDGRVFAMMTLSMHSNEVGPSQALPIFAHELAETEDPDLIDQLSKTVLMMVPCHNPDGMDMEVEYYRKNTGTKYEGSSLPGIYHRYVGHDNNRDFVTLTQKDTQVISRLFSTEWYPQVLVEKHQMMTTGPRYFVPPFHDPITENIDECLLHWTSLFGASLARDMAGDDLSGVAQHWLFDNYWPGSTETSLWKNVISFLTEAASCHRAKPVFVESNELCVEGKGLSEYKRSVNMPDPWPGGWWRLGDIVAYEISSMYSVLGTCAENCGEILKFRNDCCRAEVVRGFSQAPYYFVLPQKQHDRSEWVGLVDLLEEHGVEVKRLTKDVDVDGRAFTAGDLVVALSQPYRAFIKEVMETQQYPKRHYTPGGDLIRPYDVTSWSLPLHRGVTSLEVDLRSADLEAILEPVTANDLVSKATLPDPCWGVAFPVNDNAGFEAAFTALYQGLQVLRLEEAVEIDGAMMPVGSFVIRPGPGKSMDNLLNLVAASTAAPKVIEQEMELKASALAPRRIALVETWMHDMDAGWTRFVLDSYGIPFQVLRPGDFETTDIVESFDVMVFPDADKDVLFHGKPAASKHGEEKRYHFVDYPPEYTKGIGEKGMEKLMAFIDGGGVVVAWGGSVPLFLGELKIKRGEGEDDFESFELPVRDITEQITEKGLIVPGSFLRIELLEGHPLTYGMPRLSGIFSRGEPVLQTVIPALDMDRRVVARFPEQEILLSCYAEDEDQLGNLPAMVWTRKGRGQVVLMTFNPQFRASTQATYKLLFNALLLPEWE
ncbi:MAG: hypothetical protein KJ645_09340 [Planctomycetes bacterium]|nr:hypothetical protein [Planctomycetota bacterium]